MLKKIFNKPYTDETFKKLITNKSVSESEFERALSSGININQIDENGDTYLHYAIKNGLNHAAKLFIKHNIKLNIKNNNEDSAIRLAIDKGNRSIVQTLLATNNVNINELKNNRNLLQEAVIHGERNIIDMLLKTDIDRHHVDNRGRNVLFDAISSGDDKVIDTVLNIKDLDVNILDNEGNTILHQENVIKDDKLAIKLIQHGTNPTILDRDEKSYLLHAALRGIETEEIIDASVKYGFNLNSKVRNRNSILMEIMFAFSDISESETKRRNNLMSMATKLIKNNVDVNAINDEGETVLFQAARKLDIQACAFLIKEKVPINVINNVGNSVLSEIIYKGIDALDIIFLLLKNGADINIKNKQGQNIVEILNELVLLTHGNLQTIDKDILNQVNLNGQYIRVLSEVLSISKCNASALSSLGEPLYFRSLLNDNKSLFDLYSKFGIDINALDKDGNNILDRYIFKVMEQEQYPSNFRDNVIMLMTRKVNINKQDSQGKTLFSKLISKNDMKMFKTLFSIRKFNYRLQDNKGFTVMHDCIATNNTRLINIMNQLDMSLKNVPDNLGLLPITYAALFGKVNLVLEFISLESHFTSNKQIPKAAKEKLQPLLSNLTKLVSDDANEQHKLDILIQQIKNDFAQ